MNKTLFERYGVPLPDDVQTVVGRYNEQALLGQMSSADAARGFIDTVQSAIDAAS
ncbi:hypothetical protein AB0J86_17985 [Micromonospora sp. NPDC049559]|uniref:hypothetical protein n=1 Tax=Micromonospora sp. NPDC049559 TaxID=3155923 RepID=UPI0034496AB1